MKKLLLLVAFVVMAMTAYSQTGSKSLVLKAGYQTDFKRFGIGAEGRYNITENIRIAPDVTFFFPKNSLLGLDINLNAHYVFEVQDGLSVYPLAGIAMINNRFSGNSLVKSFGTTDFGFNLGAGASYALSSTSFVNFDIKYTFSDGDFATFMLGYGVKF